MEVPALRSAPAMEIATPRVDRGHRFTLLHPTPTSIADVAICAAACKRTAAEPGDTPEKPRAAKPRASKPRARQGVQPYAINRLFPGSVNASIRPRMVRSNFNEYVDLSFVNRIIIFLNKRSISARDFTRAGFIQHRIARIDASNLSATRASQHAGSGARRSPLLRGDRLGWTPVAGGVRGRRHGIPGRSDDRMSTQRRTAAPRDASRAVQDGYAGRSAADPGAQRRGCRA